MRIVILLFITTISFTCRAQTYRVMTYNIRFDNPQDGVNQWPNRITKVADLLKKYDPDLIGVQEALKHQLDDLVKALPHYRYVGVGRDDGKTKGEFSAILYKHDKFEILKDSTFWLSKTPDTPGSKDWDAMITRVVTTTRLKDKRHKIMYTVVNTHFDHVGVEARKQSAIMLKEYLRSTGDNIPAIITGDFNCTRADAPYHVMIDTSPTPLIDPAPENTPGTFCNFAVNSMPCRAIDYIFHTPHWKSSSYQVITDNDGKFYPSDHLPVLVEVSLRK